MSTPDVRVRLSPEGIKEIIFGLRQLEAESRKNREAAARSFGPIKAALADIKRLLPSLGLAAAVGGFIALSRAALQTADATGKIQEAVGGTVEEISGLTLAFRTNQSNQDALRAALIKTANVLGQVRSGSEEARNALHAIGIDADELANTPAPRALEKIARQLAAIEDPTKRAAAANRIFGKTAGELLIALKAVGEQGIDAFIDKARELGVLIDEDLARAAAKAADALGIIKIQAEGLATQFIAGLAPAIADSMETISEAVSGDGINGFRIFGQAVGLVLRTISSAFIATGKVIGAEVARIVQGALTAGRVVKGLATGNLKAVREALKNGRAAQGAISEALDEDLANLQSNLFGDPNKNFDPNKKKGGEGSGAVDPDEEIARRRAITAARLAARQAALQDELKLQQEYLKAEEEENKDNFAQSLKSLESYFDKRKELIERQSALELTALRAQRQELIAQSNLSSDAGGPKDEAERIKARQQIAALDAQILQRRLETERELGGLQREREQAEQDGADELLASYARIAETEGDRHKIFMSNLLKEIDEITKLGVRAGLATDDIEKSVDRMVAARKAAFNFDEVQRKGSTALQAFDRDAEQIRRDQEAGIITQLEGEQRLIALEKERLVVLQGLATAMLEAARATGNPEIIAQAEQFNASVQEIATSYRQATDIVSQFRTAGLESLQSGIAGLLQNLDKVKSVGDAFKQLALSVAQSLQKIASEIIAKQAILALVRSFGGTSLGGLFGVGAYTGGRIRGYAGGGDVRGPQLNIPGPDKVPLLAEPGEFMVRRREASKPGMYAFLRALNEGRRSLAARLLPRYQSGGVIGGGGASSTPGGMPQASGLTQNFYLSPDRQGNVSRLAVTQIRAATAAGLQESSRRNN